MVYEGVLETLGYVVATVNAIEPQRSAMDVVAQLCGGPLSVLRRLLNHQVFDYVVNGANSQDSMVATL